MHRLLVLFAVAAGLQAGLIQGVVLENVSGRPLARALVRLDPVPQSGGATLRPLITRAGRNGHFVFSAVQPGTYLIVALSNGYFPAAYGQRLPLGHGTPIPITAESDLFIELRLRHKGALTGRVLDENGVGRAGVSVRAYRARLPLDSAGEAMSDDRGVFRIAGLDPGKYWVRSAAHTMDDGSGWLPTFGPQAREVRDARVHTVNVETDTTDAEVSPEPGTLFHLSGMVGCDTGEPVTVILSSETGRRSTTVSCRNTYRFDGLAPAAYEVLATVPTGTAAGFTELFLDRDNDSGSIQVMQLHPVEIDVRQAGSGAVANLPVRLTGRRQDLSESELEHEIPLRGAMLAPGHWEFRARPPHGYYVESIINWSASRRPLKPDRFPDWFEVFMEPRYSPRLRITLSDQVGQIGGKVVVEGHPVPAAPVFLWPIDATARRALGGSLQTLSDTQGEFHFDSLPPGDYRILASFDLNELDEDLVALSASPTVHAEARQAASIELPIWVAPW